MKINEVIRQFRKKKNLTQEQVANYLGVTAPAVNKWENGNSYPDITLLAPLARVLGTNVDTLLSFHEELTDHEINQFIEEISTEMLSNGYEKTFEKANAKIKEYPNCEKLILYSAQILNGYLAMGIQDIQGKEKYEKQIYAWFELVTHSSDAQLANAAIMSLSQSYIAKGDYEQAQILLDQIPPMGFDKRVIQARLYREQAMYEKAYQVNEEMIYQYVNCVISSLMQIITFLCEEQKYDEALQYADLVEQTSKQFDIGSYVTASVKLLIYVKMQKKEESLFALEEMIVAVDHMCQVKDSKLYQHMKFNEDAGMKDLKKMMRQQLERDEEFEFLKQDVKFKMLLDTMK